MICPCCNSEVFLDHAESQIMLQNINNEFDVMVQHGLHEGVINKYRNVELTPILIMEMIEAIQFYYKENEEDRKE